MVRAYLLGTATVTVPRDSATVALVRDGEFGPDVYLIRRHTGMEFASGMYVFVGGSVDPMDADIDSAWMGPPPRAWAEKFRCSEELARMLVCAAVRETFEESGVLLASSADGALISDTTGDDWESERLSLVEGTLSFAALIERRSLVLRADLLRAWSHWITPEWSRRRFDTRFFVATVPPGQTPRDVGGEADQVGWHSCSRALTSYHSGALPMMIPTASLVRDLAAHPDAAAILSASRQIEPIMLRPILNDERIELVWDAYRGVLPAEELIRPL